MFDQMQLLETPRAAIINKVAAEFALLQPKTEIISAEKERSKTKHKTIDEALTAIFPTQQEENQILKARRVMGELLVELSDGELESYLTEFEFLLDTWLDEFEKNIFNNKTLMQLLQEG